MDAIELAERIMRRIDADGRSGRLLNTAVLHLNSEIRYNSAA